MTRTHPDPDDLRRRLAELVSTLAPVDGLHPTPWPGLSCFRASRRQPPKGAVYTPSLCVVAQGSKRATLGGRPFVYDPLHYLVLSMSLPVEAEILEASPGRPFLSLVLELDPRAVGELMLELDGDGGTADLDRQPAIAVSSMAPRLGDALVRLLSSLDDPAERRVLAPLARREVIYHLLTGEQGGLLRAAVLRAGAHRQVARVIRYLEKHHHRPLDVPTVAREVGMSTSSLHHTFKAVTSLSPMRYLKHMRLHRARLLMVHDGCGAAEAAHRVGYGSASQFSREFKRLFGDTPTGEVARFRALGPPPAAREATWGG